MAIFYRLCPEDSHTCTARECCASPEAPCKQASAERAMPLPATADPAGQAPDSGDWSCFRTLRTFQWIKPTSGA